MKLLNPRVHGYIDYIFDLILFLAPTIGGFSYSASNLCYVLGLAHLVMNLVTAYPLGLVRWMRFSTHGAVEVLGAVAIFLMPWIAGFNGFDPNGTTFFVVAGLALLGVWATTDYRDDSVRADTIDFGTRPYTDVKHPTEPPSQRRAS